MPSNLKGLRLTRHASLQVDSTTYCGDRDCTGACGLSKLRVVFYDSDLGRDVSRVAHGHFKAGWIFQDSLRDDWQGEVVDVSPAEARRAFWLQW